MLKKIINQYLLLRSFSTNRKIFVIESDDWGSLRTKGVKERESLKKINPKSSKDSYIEFDTIASKEDLDALFNTLSQYKDKNGGKVKLTANVCTANPDFEKIKSDKFTQFHYEPFQDTLKKYSKSKSLFEIWKSGINDDVFCPQLHGREHLHSQMWLTELKKGNEELLKAFDLESWGIPYSATTIQRRGNLQAALDVYDVEEEEEFQSKWLKDSVELFYQAFGFYSKTFIPPAYTWHSRILKELKGLNVEAVQGIKLQYHPTNGNKKYQQKLRYTGQEEKQIKFLTRNVFFEPSLEPQKDTVDIALRGVENAFKNNKAVIMGSHRVNYIGSLTESNRDKNLKKLEQLLDEVTKRWPDVEFMSSDQLVELL